MTRLKYNNRHCNQFVKDMEAAGLDVEHYQGRSFWEGPAVRVEDIQDALCETKIKCQHDNMGKGFIVYPVVSGKLLDSI
jgi:hypothetical protein